MTTKTRYIDPVTRAPMPGGGLYPLKVTGKRYHITGLLKGCTTDVEIGFASMPSAVRWTRNAEARNSSTTITGGQVCYHDLAIIVGVEA